MKDLSPEQLTMFANLFTVELAKNSSKRQLMTAKNFFQLVCANIQAILQEKNNC